MCWPIQGRTGGTANLLAVLRKRLPCGPPDVLSPDAASQDPVLHCCNQRVPGQQWHPELRPAVQHGLRATGASRHRTVDPTEFSDMSPLCG